MISIELWRARIGTFVSRFNCKRYSRCSSSLASSSSCNHMYHPPRKRRQNGLACSSSTFSTDLEEHSTTVSFAKPVLPSATLKLLGSTTTSSSSFFSSSFTTTTTTTTTITSPSSGFSPGSVFSLLRRSVLRDVLIILLIAIISQQLIISGDIETNPGPCLSDRPKFSQLIVLKEALSDGSDLRIVDWLSAFKLYESEDFARMLLNDEIAVRKLKSQSQDKNNVFIRAVLHNWLNRDDGEPSDPAVSRTWEALAQCVTDAGLHGALANAIRYACSERDEHTQTVSASATSATEQEADPEAPLDADTAHEAIEQEVDLSVSNLVISGSPGSGKTCTLYLSVNEPPPTERHSTGPVEKPVRAIAHAAICISGTKLRKLETKEMLRMACQTIKHKIQEIRKRKRAEAQRRCEARTPDSSTSTGKQRIRKTSNVSSPQEPPTPSSASPSHQGTTSPEASTLTQGEEEDEDEEVEEENIQVFAKLLDKISAVEASTDFLTARFVSTVDTGGQPHFMDAARLFLRNNSLYLLTIKLNEPLDAKPKFDFYINDTPITMCNTDLPLTNLQLVESLAMNVASLQLTTPNTANAESEPQQAKFMIVGTFADHAGECPGGETIDDKNKRLQDSLNEFKAERVDVDGKVIFAINAITTDPDERQETAEKLQEKITETPGITIETKVKLRWFGLLLHMLDEAEKRKVSLLHLDEVIAAGKCLKMSDEETMEAIKYFHDLNLIMHYRTTKLKHIVFVDVKPPLDKVSSLIGVSFIDRPLLNKLFKPNLPTDAQESLRDKGRFSKHILKSFSFSPPFTADVFLDLLEHLCIIARIEKSGKTAFFLPCALLYAPEEDLREKEQAYENPWILRLKMRRNIASVVVPTPKGYLPTLVVSLLNSPEFETDDFSRQYRNLMSICYGHTHGGQVYFIEKSDQLEIYYSWENEYPQHCSMIRSKILEVLVAVEKKLQFQPDILVKEDVFVCSCNDHPNPRHFCTYVSQIEKVVCEKTRKPHKLTHQQMHWFDDQTAEAVSGQSHKSEPSPQPTAPPSSPISSQGQAAKPAPQAQLQVSSTTGATPADDPLSREPTMRELLHKVASRAINKWYMVGLELEIEEDKLDAMDHTQPDRCYTKVFRLWKNRAELPFTWATIIDALKSPIVGKKRLAIEIEDWLRKDCT